MNEKDFQQFRAIVSIVLAALVAAVAALGWLLIQERRGNSTQSATTDALQQPPDQAASIKKDLRMEKAVTGKIVSIEPDSIVVDSEIIDISKLSSLDYNKSVRLPTINKKVTIAITASTQQVPDLGIGDVVTITTNEPVYGGADLTAVSISRFSSR